MAQAPHTGSLDQVIRMLSGMAQSAAFTTEVNTLVTALSTPTSWQIVDATGATSMISLAEAAGQQAMDWVDTAFNKVIITEGLRIEGPFPKLVLLGQRSQMQPGLDGKFIADQETFRGVYYVVDAVVMTSSDDATLAERKAVLLANAFDSLVARNPHLGGLVELIEAEGPPAPASGANSSTGTVGGALLRFNVMALRVP